MERQQQPRADQWSKDSKEDKLDVKQSCLYVIQAIDNILGVQTVTAKEKENQRSELQWRLDDGYARPYLNQEKKDDALHCLGAASLLRGKEAWLQQAGQRQASIHGGGGRQEKQWAWLGCPLGTGSEPVRGQMGFNWSIGR